MREVADAGSDVQVNDAPLLPGGCPGEREARGWGSQLEEIVDVRHKYYVSVDENDAIVAGKIKAVPLGESAIDPAVVVFRLSVRGEWARRLGDNANP